MDLQAGGCFEHAGFLGRTDAVHDACPLRPGTRVRPCDLDGRASVRRRAPGCFFVGLLLFRTCCPRMAGTWLLNGVRQMPQIIPAGGDMDRLADCRLDPIRNLLAGPFSLVVWWRLKPQIQRAALDLVEQKGPVRATRTTVCQSIWPLGVVQRDGVGEPARTALHDASDLTSAARFRLAEQK